MQNKTICVTGASGYIGSWIVKALLDKGYDVHATVRSLANDACNYLTLQNLSPNSTGSLKLFEANLLKRGSFDAAVSECDIVIHTASPLLTYNVKDPQKDLIEPAVNGTINVLESVNKSAGVKRVVLTSSSTAVATGCSKDKIYDESDWFNEADGKDQPYPYSKYLAEKKAIEIAAAQSRWDLIIINPGYVFGPCLIPKINDGTVGLFAKMMQGKFLFSPDFSLSYVDVRDVAEAHVRAGELENLTSGERFICTNTTLYISEIAEILKTKYRKTHFLPSIFIPKLLCFLFLPFLPLTASALNKTLGAPLNFSNQKIRQKFKMEFRPIDVTLNDMADNIIQLQLIKANYKIWIRIK